MDFDIYELASLGLALNYLDSSIEKAIANAKKLNNNKAPLDSLNLSKDSVKALKEKINVLTSKGLDEEINHLQFTAKELFEKLGYEDCSDDSAIRYEASEKYEDDDDGDCTYYDSVVFNLSSKEIQLLSDSSMSEPEPFSMNLDLLKAINRQVEELEESQWSLQKKNVY